MHWGILSKRSDYLLGGKFFFFSLMRGTALKKVIVYSRESLFNLSFMDADALGYPIEAERLFTRGERGVFFSCIGGSGVIIYSGEKFFHALRTASKL